MFTLNDDLSIYATRGDIVFFCVSAEDDGVPYHFQPGDVVRMKVFGKKDAESVYLQKDFPVFENTENVAIFLEEEDTKIGEVISKPKDYWYEVELNPGENPQTIIGYSEDGPAVFRLFPEGADIDSYEPDPEDFPVVDEELDMTSPRPIANKAVAAAVAILERNTEKDYATPKMYGAVGDGVADDTSALEDMLEAGGSVLLSEGVYLVTRPLYVNVNTTTLNGTSSRSVIKAGDSFPEGEAVITFYSPSGDYYTRRSRENTHGNFAVVGNNKTCNGVRFGGAVGGDYEGAVESSIFRNIFVDKCDAAFVWGAHAYRNTLIQCDSHSNNYCLKTADDITDTGEVFTCINCGFWSGSLYLVNCGEIMMFSCTIHTKTIQTVDGIEAGHYFKNTFVSFQDCHFEAILNTDEEKEYVYAPQFCAKNSQLFLADCTGVVTSTTNMLLDTYLFKDESDDGRSHGIFVRGGMWKYYFGRIRPGTALCSGNCELSDISLKYTYDGITMPYKIYEHTQQISTNKKGGFDYYYGIPDEIVEAMTISESTDEASGEQYFDITFPEWFDSSAIGFYRKIDISKWKSCKLQGLYYISNGDYNFTLASAATQPSIIMFADMYDNFIPWGAPNNVDVWTQGESVNGSLGKTLTMAGRAIAIPPGAKYAYIGFDLRHGGGMPSGSISVHSSMTYEFV